VRTGARYRRDDPQPQSSVPTLPRRVTGWRPFWGWQADSPAADCSLGERTAELVRYRNLPARNSAITRPVVRAWRGLEGQGLKVRGRAHNTLFARVFLADVFIRHRGSKIRVDRRAMSRFYDVRPPDYLVLSATRLLPLPGYGATTQDCRRMARLMRDLHWNPDRYLSSACAEEVQSLIGEKRRLVTLTPADSAARRERFEALRSVNDRLRPCVEDAIRRAGQGLEQCQRAEANELLRRAIMRSVSTPVRLRPFCTRLPGVIRPWGSSVDEAALLRLGSTRRSKAACSNRAPLNSAAAPVRHPSRS
jgi:hypothetical protein